MVIANSCAGSFAYQNKGQSIPYDNPFVGCRIHEKSFYNLIKYFDKINFYNFNIEENDIVSFIKNPINSIRLLDYDILIYFPHYDVFKMTNNWINRLPRLIENLKNENWNQNTLFVYNSYFNTFNHIKNKYPDEFNECAEYRNKILNEFTNRNIIIDYVKPFENYTNNKIILPFEYNHYDEVGTWIIENHPQFINK